MANSKNQVYRTEDKMTQWMLRRALEHYKQTNPFNLDPIELHVMQLEIDKLARLEEARIARSHPVEIQEFI